MSMIVTHNGRPVFYDGAVQLMDDSIRELLHLELAPCTEQEFFDAYLFEHQRKFGEEFLAGAW